ncbi:MAG: N,N-dimethylformamidase beta subunit family domain-containing protein [Hyphomicrobiaceae bacterium]
MSLRAPIPLLGYTNQLSGRPGDVIDFKVSSLSNRDFHARLVRVICADPNPEGPGIIEEEVVADFAGSYTSREQAFSPGSYIQFDRPINVPQGDGLRLDSMIWPTLIGRGMQTIIAVGELELALNTSGALVALWRGSQIVATSVPLQERKWVKVWLALDTRKGSVEIGFSDIHCSDIRTDATGSASSIDVFGSQPICVAAKTNHSGVAHHFNGKIEAPTIYASPDAQSETLLSRWDFSQQIHTTMIEDKGPHGLGGRVINLPARAMTGALWDGSEMCWRHAPEHYGAIHFHDDDIYDFNWDTDFSFSIPEDLPSGVYAARITCEEHEDVMPFFVCPPSGRRTADLCVIASTFTYTVYGNHARPDYAQSWQDKIRRWRAYPWNPAVYREYGLSTYNYHGDGSGICHASARRPLFNLKPGYLTFGYGPGSGLRHFQADSHLIAWLHQKGLSYDIVTDRELHEGGYEVLRDYSAVTTGSHPEYHTAETLNALETYRNQGGKLVYLGGNGFYWRVACHQEDNGTIEIRRAESGIRAWAAEPGEYYNAFDGAYGGLWRRNGRPPQRLVGVGFSAQGQFEGSYYRLRIGKSDPDLGWILEGIDDEILGDFGLSGGGAAGFELDRADVRLGTPENAVVVASSEDHGSSFVLVPEEILTHITNWPGKPASDLLRADMVYFDVPGGGAVFATGSITFCGSLPCNNFDNNISRLLENVFKRFLRGDR